MIDLTPLEVRKKKGDFRRALRGYEPALVDDFLDIVADRLDELVRENATLTDRVARLEHQVAENRDRERALTDALVTAQAMREEITERTTREAEVVRRTAQQEAESQLKDAEQQADTTVRDAEQRAEERLRRAHEEADARLRRAEQEASTRVREAEQEASTRLREAEQEAYRLRAEVVRTRDQEEEALRQLRARQQQLVKSYRTFLQRELTELNTIADSLQASGAEETTDEARRTEAAAETVPPVAAPSATTASAASTASAPPPAVAPAPSADAGAAPSPVGPAVAASAAAPAFAESLVDADEEEEPFAPEPVYEEDLVAEERIQRIEPVQMLRTDVPEVSEESGEAVEAEWPNLDILPEGQEPDFSRPQPNPDALRLPYLEEVEAGSAAEAGEAEPADEDPETEALLQNAARAGYRLDLDDEAELLLDEPVSDEAESDDWLDSIIEEEK